MSPETALAALELRVLQEGRKNKLRRRDVGRGPSISSITPSSPHSIHRQQQQQHTPSETTCDMTQLQPIIQPNLPQGRPRRQRSPMPALPGSDVYRQKITLSSMEEKQLMDGSGPMSQLLPPRHTPGEGRRREQDVNHRVGAFSMEGRGTRGTQQQQPQQLDSTAALESSSRQPPRSLSITSIVPVAAMVVEDLDMEELTAKEEQLREQEKELAAKMARLQAWEEELQRQKDDLELRERSVYIGPFCATPAIVQAEIVEGKDLPPRSIFASLRHSLPSGSERSDHDVTTVASCTDFVGEDQIDFTVSTTNEEMRWEEAMADLGGGPLRFFPRGERSIEEQVHYLPTPDKRAFNNLKQSWQDYQIKLRAIGAMNRSFDMPPLWHLRYLRFTSKPCGSFVEERAFQSEKKLKQRFLSLNVFTLQHQLKSKTLFPVPGLKTKGGHPMFYMRPSRYVPGKTTTKAVIDNQCYVMNTMLETELAQQEGIGFIACMDDWKMRNFEINYCYQFMMALQGVMVPVKTQLFLIVNPPAWFGIIWRLMKPMLAPSFRKRVKICNESKIAKYLAPDFAAYLPDDMSTGRVPTDAIVSDFISYRQYVESSLPQNAFPGSEDGQSTSYQSHDMPLDDQRMDQFGNWNEGDSIVSRDRAVIAVARVPRIGTDYSAASVGDSTGVGYSFQYDDDDDDLASIDAHIDDDHLSDDEDMKNAACIDLTSGTSTSA